MGNRLCCGGNGSCPSTFQKKNKTGSKANHTLSVWKRQNGTKGHEITGPMYERVLQPVSQKRSPDLTSEESNLHYADIQVYSRRQPGSAEEAKHAHSEAATEYATLHFPQARPRCDSKLGTLV